MSNSTYDDFLIFRANVIRAIAKAWSNPEYKERLLHDPKEAIESAFRPYKYPFTYNLAAQDDTAYFDLKVNGNWVVKKFDKLTLVLPPKPPARPGATAKETALVQARALAAFNASHITFLPTTDEA